MKVYRTVVKKNPDRFEVGDVIKFGKYTATCQLVDELAIFMLDQYLDEAYDHEVDMLIRLNEDLKNDKNFKKIRKHLVEWDTGLYFRLPYLGEMFDVNNSHIKDYFEPDINGEWLDQWQLMKDRRNRIADRKDEAYEWGWLMNKYKNSAAYFAGVNGNGLADLGIASYASIGVRPVFCVEATCLRDK